MKLRLESASWNKLQTTIEELYENNIYLTPYSEYKFLDKIRKTANIRRLFESKKFRLESYAVYDNDNAVLVAPLLVSKAMKRIYLLGEFSSVGHLDFIYSASATVQEIESAIDLVLSNYPRYTFCANRISQFSILKEVFNAKNIFPTSQDICVKIDLSSYDEWYKSLKKSCRQNLRTSYNRLNSDNVELSFKLFVNETPPKKLWKDNISLFSKRILEHTKLPKYLLCPMVLFKRNEVFGKTLYKAKNNIFASVILNGALAATLNGVIANDGRAIITRLSIETSFGRYSPGGLLLNETIKEVSSKYPFIKSIDLSRGDEPYKYTYGGENRYNYSYQFEISD